MHTQRQRTANKRLQLLFPAISAVRLTFASASIAVFFPRLSSYLPFVFRPLPRCMFFVVVCLSLLVALLVFRSLPLRNINERQMKLIDAFLGTTGGLRDWLGKLAQCTLYDSRCPSNTIL